LRRDCPWDARQTHPSLKRFLLEETYEVLETIEDQNWVGLREELGDLLLQVLFHARIQEDDGRFDMEHVLADLIDKMVSRHPHVFGDEDLDAAGVARRWEEIKKAEKGPRDSLFDGFVKGLPALLESYKIGRKAAMVGFDWPDPNQVLDKIEEEIGEIREALADGDRDHVQEELGDLLFAVSNLVRKHDFEPEETLRLANRKFISRFRIMEQLAREDGTVFEELGLEAQETYWQRAKMKIRQA